jgi:hypothetical protein
MSLSPGSKTIMQIFCGTLSHFCFRTLDAHYGADSFWMKVTKNWRISLQNIQCSTRSGLVLPPGITYIIPLGHSRAFPDWFGIAANFNPTILWFRRVHAESWLCWRAVGALDILTAVHFSL